MGPAHSTEEEEVKVMATDPRTKIEEIQTRKPEVTCPSRPCLLGKQRAKKVTFADFVSIPEPHRSIPVGGRLKYFKKEWEKVTSDPDILKIISGLSIPLVNFEQQNRTPFPYKFSEHEMRAADEEIQKLLSKDARFHGMSGRNSSRRFCEQCFFEAKVRGGHKTHHRSQPVQRFC